MCDLWCWITGEIATYWISYEIKSGVAVDEEEILQLQTCYQQIVNELLIGLIKNPFRVSFREGAAWPPNFLYKAPVTPERIVERFSIYHKTQN